MVVLNKIDGQWDELKIVDEIDVEIQCQVDISVGIFDLLVIQVFLVFVQKGLVVKINGDEVLFEKSWLLLLELVLFEEFILVKCDIVCDNIESEFGEVSCWVGGLFEFCLLGLCEQLIELIELCGKNKGVVVYMMGKVWVEKDEFEFGL